MVHHLKDVMIAVDDRDATLNIRQHPEVDWSDVTVIHLAQSGHLRGQRPERVYVTLLANTDPGYDVLRATVVTPALVAAGAAVTHIR